jgi:hypothetical protein
MTLQKGKSTIRVLPHPEKWVMVVGKIEYLIHSPQLIATLFRLMEKGWQLFD